MVGGNGDLGHGGRVRAMVERVVDGVRVVVGAR
jgi:hypothetical protein